MKKIIFPLFFIFLGCLANAQTVVVLDATTHNTVQTGCSYWFYDDGNVGGDYTANQDRWITFNSSDAVNTHIKISFANFTLAAGDTLKIYDGPNTSSPVLGSFSMSNPITTANSIYQASISNVSGDLTIRFKSNATNQAAGWNAAISCTPMCQAMIPTVDTLQMSPLPNDSNYVDICFGQTVNFAALGAGSGVFPENDMLYHQDSTNTLFIWDFGDGVSDTGRVIPHLYTVPSGYDVSLRLVDVHGCTSTLFYNLRVRISSNPIQEINPLPDICAGDSINLVTGENGASTIVVKPSGSIQTVTSEYDSLTFIPDGPNCAVQCYGTPVTFTTFPAGAVIQSASDISAICINMEHTFAGDLSFRIICPNGNNVVLDSYDNSGGADLGISNSNDGSPTCSASANPPGTGWTYCWSEIYPQQGTMNTLDAGTSPIPATNLVTNTGYITPQNPLSGLVGCPLNGTWSIEICDNWGADNGYVFSWDLTLTNNTAGVGWSYTVPLSYTTWNGPYINTTSDSTATILPDTSGTFTYTAYITDAFGCVYDTSFNVDVVDVPHPDLGNDTIACAGSIVTFDAGPGGAYQWSTGSNTQTASTDISGIYSVTVANSNGTINCVSVDSVMVTFVDNASVDLGADQCVTSGPVILDAHNPGFSYHWSSGETTQILNVNNSGMYSVTVSMGNFNMCGDVDSVNIAIIPTPVLNLPPVYEICAHQYADFNASQGNNNIYSFVWSNGFNTPVNHLSGLVPGQYLVTVEVTGCDVRSDSTLLTVLACDLTIPNVITPNGDGLNDNFVVSNLNYYPNSIFMVYNRWGQKVYENSDYQNDWNGGGLAEGTYFFVLRVNYGDEKYEEHHGTITILGSN